MAVNNYLHDFGAALFCACIVLAWVLRRHAGGNGTAAFLPLYRSMGRLFWISLAVTLGCGGGRAWAYRAYEWNPSMGEEQITLLVAKHIVFAVLVTVAIWYWWKTGQLLAASAQESRNL